MKLATVITLSSLLTGCAVAADDVELDRAFPEGAEVVVLYADDLADFGVADPMARPEFPRDGDQLVAEDQASDRRIVPGTPSIPDREVLPHGGDKLGLAGHGAIIIAHPKPASSLDQAQFPRHGIDTVAPPEKPHPLPMPSLPSPSLLAGDPADYNPCGCDGDKCREQWVAHHLGCGVCAVFVCGEGVNPDACNMCLP